MELNELKEKLETVSNCWLEEIKLRGKNLSEIEVLKEQSEWWRKHYNIELERLSSALSQLAEAKKEIEELKTLNDGFQKMFVDYESQLQESEERNKQMVEALDGLIKVVLKHHPNVQIPEQEDLYNSIHIGKTTIKR